MPIRCCTSDDGEAILSIRTVMAEQDRLASRTPIAFARFALFFDAAMFGATQRVAMDTAIVTPHFARIEPTGMSG